MDNPRITEGFRGQVMHVVPAPLLATALKHLLATELCLTDIGWSPRARHHYRERPEGAGQHILIYCAAGSGQFTLDGCSGKLPAHHALLIPRHCPHSYAADPHDPWSIHWVHFTGQDAAYFTGLLPPGQPVIPVGANARRKLEDLFREGYGAFDDGVTPARLLYAAQVLRHLLALLFFHNSAFTPATRQRPARDFSELIDYMKQRVADGLPLAEMARRTGLSAARFSALFKAQTGMAPGDYYLRLRVQAACRLLDTTALSIKQAAARCGFDDPYYFSRIFRKIMGAPPSVYRRTHKG